MRAMFGLVSLLVVIGVLVYVFSKTSIPTAKEGKRAQDQARQISGRGDDGLAAIDSFKVTPDFRGSQLADLEVTRVTAGGALEQYGLQKGDKIIEVNGSKVGDISNNDPETAKALIHDAYRGSQPIIVLRNGQQITLPSAATAGGRQRGSAPQRQDELQRQIDTAVRIP